uniref:Coenzyme F420 hydrogenase/dehydrogenase beta subunit C-terminal domain-containing protein n=1 Tax=Calcidiscus leptoporus TaxID=127549 RepID=A0A7S0NYQ9_9EUKA|mmetsp:Transcript_40948/g.95629  ORF Transcript_40948/g.95629 Transcript_40948/m.95629 type:complete len:262 (+) Transcript_40948:627-1412(+)
MADFRVHARLASAEGGDDDEVVKAAYMTLPPSLAVPSIADSCFHCFDYTNGLADLVVGYMGAPFDAAADEMTSAALMVTVRNGRGRQMLQRAIARQRVEVLQDGGHGGGALPSSGDRRELTLQTVSRDTMVRSLLEEGFVAAEVGAPPWLGELLASLVRLALPQGLEFGKYSIDYHYLRNQLVARRRMGEARAARHIPTYAKAIMRPYEAAMRELEVEMRGVASGKSPAGSSTLVEACRKSVGEQLSTLRTRVHELWAKRS